MDDFRHDMVLENLARQMRRRLTDEVGLRLEAIATSSVLAPKVDDLSNPPLNGNFTAVVNAWY